MFEELIEEMRNHYGQLWIKNDRAHQEPHFKEVSENFRIIAEKLGEHRTLFLRMGTIAAYTHDMFRHVDKDKHHMLSGRHWRESDDPFVLSVSPLKRQMIAEACEEHRASFSGTYSSKFSEIFAVADRGLPRIENISNMLKRSIAYHIDVNGLSEAEAIKEASQHLKDKYGPSGYAQYPKLVEDLFKEELQQYREAFLQL
jgi:exopolyphosphatase/pppGpp-phosphohydrolase